MDLDRDQLIKKFTSPEMDYEVSIEKTSGRSCRVFKKAPSQLKDLYDSQKRVKNTTFKCSHDTIQF